MPDQPDTPVTTPVTDRRPVPQGVLPRGVQTWLMAGLAAAMLLIIVLTGRPDAPTPVRQATATPATTNPDRVREYQDRLRLLEAQAVQPAELPEGEPPLPPSFEDDVAAPPRVDPVDSERKRREYESLFASNVVLSRRPDNQRPDGGANSRRPGSTNDLPSDQPPSIDAIADAVVRATRTQAGAAAQVANVQTPTPQAAPSPAPVGSATGTAVSAVLQSSSPNRVLEGTLIDAVLTNRLDGGMAAPVSCLVTNPVYALSGRDVLIPAGARVLGETRPVQALGEARLAVLFHRLILPDGRTLALDQFKGLNQIGDAGLRDKVNHHYWSTFGAASAVGLVSGLSQLIGSAGIGLGDGDRTVVVAGNVADTGAQATAQVMTRFLNRLPTVTIREGHRVKVYVTSDLDLPVWESGTSLFGRR
ncbi:TrbI/VirB10 family protein [Luteitalea sp.]|uniref:TrbI/VirB10 family protein n=1 Tax=Luteitalea sp. TaxID=2004800 RepID=UPI0025BCC457|nr:TrbI/VirB10 family protein [Luteitalea sp.]